MVLADSKGPSDSDALTLGGSGCPTAMPAGSYLLLCKDGDSKLFNGTGFALSTGSTCGFSFGIGGTDTISLYATGGTTKIDTSGGLGDLGTSVQSQGRPTVGKAWGIMPRTPGVLNIDPITIAPPPPSPANPPAIFPPLVASAIIINEVAATGNANDICSGEDWIELWNPSGASASLVNMILVDDKGHGDSDQLVLGATGCPTSMPAGSYVLFCKSSHAYLYDSTGSLTSTHNGCGFAFGLGGTDIANLFTSVSDNTLISSSTTSASPATDGTSSWARPSVDGTGSMVTTKVRTPGKKNVFLVVNEMATDGNSGDICAGADW